MTQYLFSLLFVFASFTSFAQTDQVITLKGDTLTGKVIISNGKKSFQSVTVKVGKEKNHFKVYEVKSVTKGNDLYNTLKVNGKYQLGLLVIEGYLSLYMVMDTEVSSSNEFSSKVLIKKDGSELVVPNIGFKKYVESFLNDCKIVAKGFENDEYKKKDLPKIVKDYNNCIEVNTANAIRVKQIVNLDSPKLDQVDVLIKAIKADASLPEINSVLDMLNDLKSKIMEDSEVPSYLENALRDALKVNEAFTTQLNKILA